MSIVHLMIPGALLLGLIFAVCFPWAVRQGQYDDLDTPAFRILVEDENESRNRNRN